MPKFVDVELDEVSADFFPPDPDRRVQLRGRVFGTTFNKDPFEQKQLKDIFMFPEGPIEIAHGQTVKINDAEERFAVSTPSTEPPRLNGQWLKFGGELDNFGSGFTEDMHTNVIHTPEEGRPVRVRIRSGEQEIRLDFTMTVDGFF
ncbi:MAG: hypothetical protein M3259_10255 [Actinomycetota bacterium]|nr:hypothetical protein [Actinomycetota bacterium]